MFATTAVVFLSALLATGCDSKTKDENVASLPTLPTWVTSSGNSQSGATIDVVHPFTWRAATSTPAAPGVVYNGVTITPDSGALTLALPDQSGLFVFGQDSVSATLTANDFIERKVKLLAGAALRADTSRLLSADTYQADVRTKDGSKTGIMYLVLNANGNAQTALWRVFLGDADGNALALQIAIDSLRVRNK